MSSLRWPVSLEFSTTRRQLLLAKRMLRMPKTSQFPGTRLLEENFSPLCIAKMTCVDKVSASQTLALSNVDQYVNIQSIQSHFDFLRMWRRELLQHFLEDSPLECPWLSLANLFFDKFGCWQGAKIQLLDLPGIIEGAKDGKGRGKQARRGSCVDGWNMVEHWQEHKPRNYIFLAVYVLVSWCRVHFHGASFVRVCRCKLQVISVAYSCSLILIAEASDDRNVSKSATGSSNAYGSAGAVQLLA